MEKHIFNAGPCKLPQPAIDAAIAAIRDFDNTGVSILSISHRTPGWERIMADIHAQCVKHGRQSDGYINYVKGANVAGFLKVAKAMLAQGIV